MPRKRVIQLSQDEKTRLYELIHKGKASTRVITRARILLLSDQGKSDSAIAEVLHSCISTAHRTRERYIQEGLDAALSEKSRPGAQRKLSGEQEVVLIATACSNPPEGRENWSLRMLGERLVELELVDSISYETVRRTLKKTKPNPGSKNNGASQR